MLKRGQPTAAATQQRTKGIQYIVKKKKIVVPIKINAPTILLRGEVQCQFV